MPLNFVSGLATFFFSSSFYKALLAISIAKQSLNILIYVCWTRGIIAVCSPFQGIRIRGLFTQR